MRREKGEKETDGPAFDWECGNHTGFWGSHRASQLFPSLDEKEIATREGEPHSSSLFEAKLSTERDEQTSSAPGGRPVGNEFREGARSIL